MPDANHGDMPPDPLPGLIAELDQALEMAGQMARVAWGIYDAFREQGFTDKQALFLTACQFRAPEAPGE